MSGRRKLDPFSPERRERQIARAAKALVGMYPSDVVDALVRARRLEPEPGDGEFRDERDEALFQVIRCLYARFGSDAEGLLRPAWWRVAQDRCDRGGSNYSGPPDRSPLDPERADEHEFARRYRGWCDRRGPDMPED